MGNPRSGFVRGHNGRCEPCAESSAVTLKQLRSRTSREKRALLRTRRWCHQQFKKKKTSREVNGGGEKKKKSMSKITPKISTQWPSNQKGHPRAGTNPLSPAPRTNCLAGTLPRARKVCWGVNCCQENSSPVGPEVWVVVMFSATKAVTWRESTQCEKATLQTEKKWQFYCQIRSSPRSVNEPYLVSRSVQGKISLVYSQDEGQGKREKNSSLHANIQEGKAQKQWRKYHTEASTKKPPFGIATTRGQL